MEKARTGFKGMLVAVVLLLSAGALAACLAATSTPTSPQAMRDSGSAAIGALPVAQDAGASSAQRARPAASGGERRCSAVLPPACGNVGSADVRASREMRSRSGGAIDVVQSQVALNKIVSFVGDADLDGDGTQETVEVGRYPLPGANAGDTYLHVRKGTQTIAYPFDELERRGYSEYVELQDVDGDGLPEILISRDIGGNGLGGGRVLKLQDNALACIFYTETQKPDIRITYADQYQLLVQSGTMQPSKVKFPLQRGVKYETVYDENGKLINQQEAMIDPSSGMRSVPTEHSGPADIEVTQVCSGVGGHSDTLGTIQTVYRYQPRGWEIVSTTFAFSGQ